MKFLRRTIVLAAAALMCASGVALAAMPILFNAPDLTMTADMFGADYSTVTAYAAVPALVGLGLVAASVLRGGAEPKSSDPS